MRRRRPPAMSYQHVCPLLVTALLLPSIAAPVPDSKQPPPAPVLSEAAAPRPHPARTPPAGRVPGYVRGRDGRRVAAISRQDLLQFRRLAQPRRLLLQRRVQHAPNGRVVIAYTSALTSGPDPGAAVHGELPDRVVTEERPPSLSEDERLEAALQRAREEEEEERTEAAVEADETGGESAEENPTHAGDGTAEDALESSTTTAVVDAEDVTIEGSGSVALLDGVDLLTVAPTSASATLQPLDDQRDLEPGDDDPPERTGVIISHPAEDSTTVIPAADSDSPHVEPSPETSQREATDDSVAEEEGEGAGRHEEDSDVLLAIANDDIGGGASGGVGFGAGPRPPDSIPSTRDVAVHGPHVFPAGRPGLSPDTADSERGGETSRQAQGDESSAEPEDSDSDNTDNSDSLKTDLHQDSSSPVLAAGVHRDSPGDGFRLNVSVVPAADTVRREARGPLRAPAAPPLGVGEISAVTVGCVVLLALVVLGVAAAVQRTGALKRRSILSDPPLDDTRLSYINASTEFSSSDLGDEMTNLENLDNDSFLNSLESMTDSAATQSCWSRDIRHSKL